MSELHQGSLNPLIFYVLLTMVIGTCIGLARFYFVGTKKFSYATLTPGEPQGPRWYSSLNRIFINSLEALTLFAPMIILQMQKGSHLETVSTLAWVFLIGRVLYTLVYLGKGYTILCSLTWLIGFVATLVGWLLLLA